MDRYCKGCYYIHFERKDGDKTCGFCGYRGIIELCKKNYVNQGCDFEEYFKSSLKRFKGVKDLIPSCQLVQTCLEGNCPYYTRELYPSHEDASTF